MFAAALRLILLLAALLTATPALAQTPALMPWPSEVELRTGALPVQGAFTVTWTGIHDDMLDRAARRFIDDIDRRTGLSHERPGPALEIAVASNDARFLT